MALLMLLEHLGAYLYILRSKMSKKTVHTDQYPYRHKKGYLGVIYHNCDMFIRLVGKPPKITCGNIFVCKSVLKCVLTLFRYVESEKTSFLTLNGTGLKIAF